MKKAVVFTSLLLVILFAAISCSSIAEAPITMPIPSPSQRPPEKNIIITAVGDIMMHSTQIKAGYQAELNTYDFSSFFHLVKPHFQNAHFVIGNLETTLGTNQKEYGGYPHFNAPAILAQNLKEAGFHLLITANNHALDKGFSGLQNTLHHLDEVGLLHTGTARSQQERDTILLTEIENVPTAFLAYTYGTNGLLPPADRPFAVNYLEQEQIINDIKRAREAGAQLVILSLHFGDEYQDKPNKTQTALAQTFLEAGADIILGTHPHVLQPVQICYLPKANFEAALASTKVSTGEASGDKGSNGDRELSGDGEIPSGGEKKFVSYSLGNFISDQNGLPRRTAIILNLHLSVDALTGKPYFKKADYIPIWTRKYTKNNKVCFEVVPIEQAIAGIRAGKTTEYTPAEVKELEQAWEHVLSCLATENEDFCLQRLK